MKHHYHLKPRFFIIVAMIIAIIIAIPTEVESYTFIATVTTKSENSFRVYFNDGTTYGSVRLNPFEYNHYKVGDYIAIEARAMENFGQEYTVYSVC